MLLNGFECFRISFWTFFELILDVFLNMFFIVEDDNLNTFWLCLDFFRCIATLL